MPSAESSPKLCMYQCCPDQGGHQQRGVRGWDQLHCHFSALGFPPSSPLIRLPQLFPVERSPERRAKGHGRAAPRQDLKRLWSQPLSPSSGAQQVCRHPGPAITTPGGLAGSSATPTPHLLLRPQATASCLQIPRVR